MRQELNIPTWIKVIILIHKDKKGNTTITNLGTEFENYNYSWVHRIINEFERKGLLTREKTGRRKILKLTNKGKKIATMLEEITGEIK